jgi:hypothetical protein
LPVGPLHALKNKNAYIELPESVWPHQMVPP